MNREIDLRRLRYFVLLAEQGNFTRAAEIANLSQTAFSRSIQTLEEQVGVRLFDRGTRTVQLTPAGSQLLDRARNLLVLSDELLRNAEGIANADYGYLSFGASLMALDGFLKKLVLNLSQTSPALSLNVEVNHWRQLRLMLDQDRIEFFVSYPGPLIADSDYFVTPLQPLPSSIYCRPDHPLLSQERKPRPSDLTKYRWAMVQLRESPGVCRQKLFGMSASEQLPVGLISNNLALLREVTLGTNMLLFSWKSWLQEYVEKGVLIDIGGELSPALPKEAMELELAIVQKRGRSLTPAANRLVDMIVKSNY